MVSVTVAPPKKTIVSHSSPSKWQRGRGLFVLSVALFCMTLCSLWAALVSKNTGNATPTKASKNKSNQELLQVHRETIKGFDVLFAEPTRNVVGILFVAHGCSHSHTDWFVDCQGCIGLPEERAIVDIGLEHNLVVVAISSTNRKSKCWSLENDIEPVGEVLRELHQRYKSPESRAFHVFAFGASSGGAFVSGLATPLKDRYGISLTGFISQIAASQLDEATSCQVFITMNADQWTDQNAQHIVGMASSLSTPIRTRHIRVPSLPITPEYFSSRISEISLEDSASMAMALHDGGLLDKEGYLKGSSRQSTWRKAFWDASPPIPAVQRDSLIADESPISEVINVADGMHEMTRDGVKEALEFCLSVT